MVKKPGWVGKVEMGNIDAGNGAGKGVGLVFSSGEELCRKLTLSKVGRTYW